MELAMKKSCRSQLTKVVNEGNTLLTAETFSVSDACIQIAKIKAAQDSLNKANEKASDFVPTDQIEHECEKIIEYEEKAVVAIAQLERKIVEANQVVVSVSNALENNANDNNILRQQPVVEITGENSQKKMSVRLPKLDLIKFSGNYHEWPAFWEQFDSAINSNESLDETAKFSYLKTVLIGNAAISIQGLAFSRASYKNAIQLLKGEYGDKEKIIDSYIQKLLSINPIKNRNDIVSLRKLYNTTLKITKSLQSLGIEPSNYGILVKSIILKVLPYGMRIEFNKRHATHDLGSDDVESDESSSIRSGTRNRIENEHSYENQISKLLSFIKLEVDSVEQARILSDEKGNEKVSEKVKDKFNNIRKESKVLSNEFTAAGLYTAVREQCLFCKSKEHLTMNCNNASLSLSHKKNILKSSARCFRCTKTNHNSRFCKTNIQCSKCKHKHATTMCDPDFVKKKNTSNAECSIERDDRSDAREQSRTNLFANGGLGNVYLQTACAQIVNCDPEREVPQTFVRLVIDGGSQLTFIKECISRKLGLPVIGCHKLSIMSFGKSERAPSRICKRVCLKLKGLNESDLITINAIEVPEICFDSLSPPCKKDPIISEFATKYVLADVCHENVIPGISLLIGADYYWKVVTGEIKKLSNSQMAVNTGFGWTIHGVSEEEYGFSLNVNVVNVFHAQADISNYDEVDLKNFWDLETIGIHGVKKVIENNTAGFLKEKIVFENNRYSVSLPWINNDVKLDTNFNGAMSRLKTLTSKLIRTQGLKAYDSAVQEYFENDCAECSPSVTSENKTYYMPHRPVYRNDKDTTKIRVVFDASAHGFGLSSLNDWLTPGENLVPLLLKVLMNFRIGAVALTADIEKAFLQIEINDIDRDAHSFLWYESPIKKYSELPKIAKFRMKRVTFGVTCSPFILAAVLRKHLTEQPENLKRICEVILRSFYVDDLVLTMNTVSDAYQIYTNGKRIMAIANMNLRKWSTNNAQLEQMIKVDYANDTERTNSPTKKILGLNWYPETDELHMDIKTILETGQGPITKRKILQTIAKIYDPLGLLSPFTITAKILLQKIWLRKYDWDAVLSEDLCDIWIKWFNELPELTEYFVPRCIMRNLEDYVELHIFADASPQAYGAVAYLRVTENDGIIKCNILMAKNRVAPMNQKGDKELTLPKLELTAALCAARLQDFIITNFHIKVDACVLWTDSKIALHWIKGKATRWKPYVCHRVTEIQKLSVGDWRHCPGTDNPADLVSRGLKANCFIESKGWRHGPDWLTNNKEEWPSEELVLPEDVGPVFVSLVQTDCKENKDEAIFPIENFSDLEKVLRITAYVFRFIKILKGFREFPSTITKNEMIESEIYWIKITQKQNFRNEVMSLNNGKQIDNQSSLLTLNPFLDKHGIMRLGGRLQDSLLSYDTKHPVLLPKKSYFTDRLIWISHIATCHGGVNMTITHLRRKFWIIQARQRVKSVLNNCMSCKKLRAKSANEPFAPLPRDRLNAVSPFKITGVDFAGPVFIKTNNGNEKIYIMLLTCAVIRAVHLEVVPDLTAESCIRALRRFISRRGVPDVIYSDNAKTFKRTAKELTELSKILCSDEIQNLANHQRIQWKFNVECASWWGGFWERLVKSMKDALKLTLQKKLIGYDEFQTVLAEVEATINARPLTYIHSDPDDLLILTPGHFLLGENHSGFIIDLYHPEIKRNDILMKWKFRNNIQRKFWIRWSTDYLQQLRGAHLNGKVTSKNLKEGDIVLLHDQNLPRLQWKIVRITKTFMGRDGRIRACELVTSKGTVLRRPIQLLYPLELTAAGEDVENSVNVPLTKKKQVSSRVT